MKYLKALTATTMIFGLTVVGAQEMKNEKGQEEVKNETTSKTLTFYENGKKVKNSVTINTMVDGEVKTDPKDKGMVNGDRIFSPVTVVKTIEIDRDADNDIDEVIKFSYKTEEKTDFALVSSGEELMVAVEDGKNIKILENQDLKMKEDLQTKTTYVYTDNKGEEIEFVVEKEMNKKMSK